MTTPQAAPTQASGVAIGDAIARLYLDEFGKGPLHTECHIAGDVITLILRDVYTPVEHKLIQAGRIDAVLATRGLWQNATRETIRTTVAAIVGRPVQSVISGFELEEDLATEVFVLGPVGG